MDAIINEILNPILVNSQPLPKRLHIPVIEISSRGSCGKTQLLYYICAVSTLPKWLNGKNCAVVVIDCLWQFNVDRLYVVMKGYAMEMRKLSKQDPLTNKHLHRIIKNALKHVHIFQTRSSLQLLNTLKTIKPYLCGETEHKHYSAKKRVDCIMIDGISDQIFKDRFNDYWAIMVDEDDPNHINIKERYENITNELRALAKAFCCYIVVTNMGWKGRYDPDTPPVLYAPGEKRIKYRPRKLSSFDRLYMPWKAKLPIRPRPFDRPYLKHLLPEPWTPFVNVKLVLRPVPPKRFPPNTTVLQALKMRDIMPKELRRFVGFSDTIGLGGGLQKAVRATNGGTGQFHFTITEDGVQVGI